MMTSRNQMLAAMFLMVAAVLGLAAAEPLGKDEKGDPNQGGRLYAAWDLILEVDLPAGEHPLWSTQKANKQTGIFTWRCSSCHGWDYQGEDGASGKGRPGYTGFPGVLGVRDLPNKEIRAWLDGRKNEEHNFTPFLNDDQIDSLVEFLNSQLIELPLIIDQNSGESLGNGVQGEKLYKAECRSCHGIDGAKINFGTASQPDFVGNRADDNPWKVVHLIRFGHLEALAPTAEEIGFSVINIADLLAYAQVLPTAYMPEPTNQPVNELDISTQGDTTSLVIAGIVIAVMIVGTTTWISIRDRIGPSGKPLE